MLDLSSPCLVHIHHFARDHSIADSRENDQFALFVDFSLLLISRLVNDTLATYRKVTSSRAAWTSTAGRVKAFLAIPTQPY